MIFKCWSAVKQQLNQWATLSTDNILQKLDTYLDDEGLVSESGWNADKSHVVCAVQEHLDAVINALQLYNIAVYCQRS